MNFRVKELTEQVEQSSNETRRLQEDVTFKESELEVWIDTTENFIPIITLMGLYCFAPTPVCLFVNS